MKEKEGPRFFQGSLGVLRFRKIAILWSFDSDIPVDRSTLSLNAVISYATSTRNAPVLTV